jgi:phosphoribosylaminoimidazole carboxylase (NCAIR synthetase)
MRMVQIQDQVWVELVGEIIVARIRGELNEELLNERHERILQLAQDTKCRKLLIDDLELVPPDYAAVEAQQVLNQELNQLSFKIAILVPNSRLAYLARLQFGDENHRVFYNDMAAAALWLVE